MATDRSRSSRNGEFSVVGMLAFLAVVALFILVSAKAGTRAVGACMVAGALIQHREGRIAFGWEGQPPSGYITGWLARLLSLIFGALGLAVSIWPEVAMAILGWDRQ
jgi:hypothetical protein